MTLHQRFAGEIDQCVEVNRLSRARRPDQSADVCASQRRADDGAFGVDRLRRCSGETGEQTQVINLLAECLGHVSAVDGRSGGAMRADHPIAVVDITRARDIEARIVHHGSGAIAAIESAKAAELRAGVNETCTDVNS